MHVKICIIQIFNLLMDCDPRVAYLKIIYQLQKRIKGRKEFYFIVITYDLSIYLFLWDLSQSFKIFSFDMF